MSSGMLDRHQDAGECAVPTFMLPASAGSTNVFNGGEHGNPYQCTIVETGEQNIRQCG